MTTYELVYDIGLGNRIAYGDSVTLALPNKFAGELLLAALKRGVREPATSDSIELANPRLLEKRVVTEVIK